MKYLKATIDRIEGKIAVLVFADNQKLNIPLSNLPKDSKEGSVINISFLSDIEATQNQEELAKKILEEILNNK